MKLTDRGKSALIFSAFVIALIAVVISCAVYIKAKVESDRSRKDFYVTWAANQKRDQDLLCTAYIMWHKRTLDHIADLDTACGVDTSLPQTWEHK